ncbi:MAG TPA: methionine synthase [Bacillota bacterium]
MISKVKYFERIPATAKRKSILLRLGYNQHLTVINDTQQLKLDDGIRRGIALCNLAGAYLRIRLSEHSPEKVVLENGQVIPSVNLARLLKNSDEVLLMGATVGAEIVTMIHQEITDGDPSQAVILDAVASETADAGLDWIMDLFNKLLAREGKKLTKHRYSPGYGDLALANQKIIFDLLDLGKLDLMLTKEYILIPEKSVLALAGIEPSVKLFQ